MRTGERTNGVPAWVAGRGMAAAELIGGLVLLVAATAVLFEWGGTFMGGRSWGHVVGIVLALGSGGMVQSAATTLRNR